MPFLTVIYIIITSLTETLGTATTTMMDATSTGTASTFSWILAIIILMILTIVPFIYVIKGYGINILGKEETTT